MGGYLAVARRLRADMSGRAGPAIEGQPRRTMRTKKKSGTRFFPNPHPGEILLEEFLSPMRLSQTALARAIGVPPRRINEIVLGKRAITADTDLRLARYFRMSEGFFLGLQTDYELMQRRRQIGDKLKAIRPRAA